MVKKKLFSILLLIIFSVFIITPTIFADDEEIENNSNEIIEIVQDPEIENLENNEENSEDETKELLDYTQDIEEIILFIKVDTIILGVILFNGVWAMFLRGS